jgi:hypothetical protein
VLLKPRERDTSGTALILELDTAFGSQEEINLVLTNNGEIGEVLLEEASGSPASTTERGTWTHQAFSLVHDSSGAYRFDATTWPP